MNDYSQSGESKVLLSIFEKIGTKSKFAVEFGAADGFWLSNIRMFLEMGWDGLQMEGIKDPKNNVKNEFITRDNINSLFKKYEVPENLDLLSIDLDGNDYWIWKSIDYLPSVVITEYNCNFHKDVAVSLEYDENHRFDGSHAYGASFRAFDNLANSKGYYLYAEIAYTNLIFVRNDFKDLLGVHSSVNNLNNLPVPMHGRILAPNKRFIEV